LLMFFGPIPGATGWTLPSPSYLLLKNGIFAD
jgi:hypothetical protein